MLLPNRHGNSSDYRYGYQGSEKDDEIKGNGNSYTTYFRQYDPRVARWLSIDPVTFPNESPYTSMKNNPILFNDVKGDCPPCAAILAWLASLEGASVVTTVGIYQQRDNIRNGGRALGSLAERAFTLPSELPSIVPGGFTPSDSPELEVETFPEVSEALRQEVMEQVLPVQDNIPAFRGGLDKLPVELQAPSIETIPIFNDSNFSSQILEITIGLGLDEDLTNFRGQDVTTWKNAGFQNSGLTDVDWGRMASGERMWIRLAVSEAMNNASSIIFDATGFINGFDTESITQYEFDTIISNLDLLEKTKFVIDGKEHEYDPDINSFTPKE